MLFSRDERMGKRFLLATDNVALKRPLTLHGYTIDLLFIKLNSSSNFKRCKYIILQDTCTNHLILYNMYVHNLKNEHKNNLKLLVFDLILSYIF